MITITESLLHGYFSINGVDYPKNQYTIEFDNTGGDEAEKNFSLVNIYTGKKIIASRGFAEVVGVTEWHELTGLLNELGALKNNDVSINDQTTAPVIGFFNKVIVYSISSSSVAIGANTITVDTITNFATGQYIQIFSPNDKRFYQGEILAINTNTIKVDTPFDFAFPAGSYVIGSNKNMNVNGSVTPQIFSLRNSTLGLDTLDVDFDITRIMFVCTAASAVDLSKFGDIVGGLTNGLVFRRIDGITRNTFNAKTNGDLASIMFDFSIQTATNPAQGQDGFIGRLTFAGNEKIGVALRIKSGEDLQFIVQDDLSTLTSFYIIAEGHEVIY